ncbi:MAG: HEPN domain-containing protein [Dehalococcoidales bacterium]|nr:HEPN domain-containing protein [Dehalococcoidales bacterium]
MAEYLLRAKVEYNFPLTTGDGEATSMCPINLPVQIGEFKLDHSPNSNHYLADLDWEPQPEEKPDWNYPISLLYIEAKFKCEEHENPLGKADEILEQLEATFRLFQHGGIYIRSYQVFHIKDQKLSIVVMFRFLAERRDPSRINLQGDYIFDDKVVKNFTDYFDKYWDIIGNRHHAVWNAIYRFSTSYEERTNSDRLLELMISLESLYSDGEYHSYKIPLRCASLLFLPGDERKSNFNRIQNIYHKRSRIVHGDITGTEDSFQGEADYLENIVRKSVNKFLEMAKSGILIEKGHQLDNMLFFT